MSDTDSSGLWPRPETLAAGDEEQTEPYDGMSDDEERVSPSELPIVNVSHDYLNEDWPRARPYQEDGHLAADEYRKEHPDA